MRICLREAYKRTDYYDCYNFFKSLWEFQTNQINKNEFEQEITKSKFKFELKNTQSLSISGRYVPSTGFTIISVSQGILNLLKSITSKFDAYNYSQLKKIADYFWSNFVHEDTHKQQAEVTPLKFFDKYVKFDNNTNPFDLNILNNLKYFNQLHEADAFGREAGRLVEFEYLETNHKDDLDENDVQKIFEKLRKNEFEDEHLLEIIKTYRDPRITKSARESFLRAMYDYLAKEEI